MPDPHPSLDALLELRRALDAAVSSPSSDPQSGGGDATKELQQWSLLERSSNTKIPKEIETRALELLVQMLIAVIPAIEAGEVDEQNQK